MPRRLTREQFIERATLVHGEKYDYSKVEYINSSTHVTVVCPKHGPWSVTPGNLMSGWGCRRCGVERRTADRRISLSEFLDRAREVHGDRYDYSRVVALDGVNNKVEIVCTIHGPWSTVPKTHMSGSGCPSCSYIDRSNRRRRPVDDFIEEANAVHGGRYSYALVDFVDMKTKVTVSCPIHGQWAVRPLSHLRGDGCPACGKRSASQKVRHSADTFIERARAVHGERYGYANVEYSGTSRKVQIDCPSHGTFLQTPNNHLSGAGCPQCGNVAGGAAIRLTQEQFLKRAEAIHGATYDYSTSVYRGNRQPIEIICRLHGSWTTTPQGHLIGAGCPRCVESRGEREVRRVLDGARVEYVAQWRHPTLRDRGWMSLDFALPERRLAIEFDGDFHRLPVLFPGDDEQSARRRLEDTQRRDRLKDEWCRRNGWQLLRISSLPDVESSVLAALDLT